MQQSPLGLSGLSVSRLGIGTLMYGTRVDDATVARILSEALDLGINFIDTAESYGDGRSEESIGEALAGSGARDRFVLATKVYTPRARADVGRNSRENLLASIDGSLARLKTDRVDLLQLHHPDPLTPFEETFETLDRLVKSGKVRHIGLSNHYGWQLGFLLGELRHRGWAPFVSTQHAYSILDRQIEIEVIPFARKFSIALLAYEPLAQGLLTGRPERDNARVLRYQQDPAIRAILQALPAMAQPAGLSMAQLGIVWLMAKPQVTSAIVGGETPEQFRALAAAVDHRLDERVIREIDELSADRIYSPYPNQPITEGPGVR